LTAMWRPSSSPFQQAKDFLQGKQEKLYFLPKGPERLSLLERFGQTLYQRFYRRKLPVKTLINKLRTSSRHEAHGLAIVLAGEYGRRNHPREVWSCFKYYAAQPDKQVRAITALAFKRVLDKHKAEGFRFLKGLLFPFNKNKRYFVADILSWMAADRKWRKEPEKILGLICWFLKDGDTRVKHIAGGTLAELSRHYPEQVLIFLARELPRGNLHTYWIAYRACAELVRNKKYRDKVLKLLNIDEYSYKGKQYR
jgi:hypothetical protein